jgi:hypothetical protein
MYKRHATLRRHLSAPISIRLQVGLEEELERLAKNENLR